jgi:tripartite-type tricarboxylate transporter receptor subunit TctC
MKGAYAPGVKLAARTLLLSLAGIAPISVCGAQDAADFYRGRTMRILVGTAVGGDYDTQARLISRHIGRHVPGEPSVIVENMTGAGGMNMANYLFSLAPKDGTTIAVLPNNFPALQWAGGRGIQFDVAQFGWLGGLTTETETMVAWHASGVKTLDDVKRQEVIAGATGRGAITYTFPAMMNTLLGTKFKIVTGYTGGSDVNLAMERGEVVARINSWTSWKATKPEWVQNGWINVLVQAGRRHPDLANVPSLEPMARSPEDRQLMEVVNLGNQLGRPLATPPGVPAERLKVLREAFRKTSADPKLVAEAASMRMELSPSTGEEMQEKIGRVLNTPKELVARAKDFLE